MNAVQAAKPTSASSMNTRSQPDWPLWAGGVQPLGEQDGIAPGEPQAYAAARPELGDEHPGSRPRQSPGDAEKQGGEHRHHGQDLDEKTDDHSQSQAGLGVPPQISLPNLRGRR